MSIETLAGKPTFVHHTAGYALSFPAGWTLDSAFARHDVQALPPAALLDRVLSLQAFTQFFPELATQSRLDFLQNFGAPDFNEMILSSFADAFELKAIGDVPVKQRQVEERVWFEGHYLLRKRSTGDLTALRYDFTFEAGWLFHFKSYIPPDRFADGCAEVEPIIRSFNRALLPWCELPDTDRTSILAKLQASAGARSDADRDLYASRFGASKPEIDVYACTHAGRELHLSYVFDDWDSCLAQSGSDWNYHRIYAGVAVVDGGRVVRNDIEQKRKTYVHEYEEPSYDRAAELRAVRGALVTATTA